MQQELIALNEVFMQNGSCGDEQCRDVFSYYEKGSYVCLTAPHATQVYAAKHVKVADLYTGAITKYISEAAHYSCIVRNKYMPEKVLISEFILQNKLEKHFFLDIHAMKDGNGFDLAIGTGHLAPAEYGDLFAFIDVLSKKYNLKYAVNDERYTGRVGLTGRLQKATGRACVLQLEWSRKYRDIFRHLEYVEGVTVPFICELSKFIEAQNASLTEAM